MGGKERHSIKRRLVTRTENPVIGNSASLLPSRHWRVLWGEHIIVPHANAGMALKKMDVTTRPVLQVRACPKINIT